VLKILYITNGITGSGGLERVLSLKAGYLADEYNYDVHILSLNEVNKIPFYQFSDKITFHSINITGSLISRFLSYKKGVKKVVDDIKPKIISVCDDGLKGLLFKYIFKINVSTIYERHASIELNFIKGNRTWLKKLENYFVHRVMIFGAKKFDAFIILTNSNKNDWLSVTCKVIPNPSPFIIQRNINNIDKLVLAVGSQSYNKGYDRLIEIWNSVNKDFPNWKLQIIGKKNKSINLKSQIDDLGLHKSIKVIDDPLQNIEEYYKGASLYVMPSRTEGFGMVLIEAMSFGLPCIAFDCPHGPRNIINNGKDGYLISNGDNKEFEKKLKHLMNNLDEREIMGRNALENAKKYNIKKVMLEWDLLFKSLLN